MKHKILLVEKQNLLPDSIVSGNISVSGNLCNPWVPPYELAKFWQKEMAALETDPLPMGLVMILSVLFDVNRL
jgi:hypothetical protein